MPRAGLRGGLRGLRVAGPNSAAGRGCGSEQRRGSEQRHNSAKAAPQQRPVLPTALGLSIRHKASFSEQKPGLFRLVINSEKNRICFLIKERKRCSRPVRPSVTCGYSAFEMWPVRPEMCCERKVLPVSELATPFPQKGKISHYEMLYIDDRLK